MVRRKGSTLRTSFKILSDFPVARWRGGGRHLPVTMTLFFRRFQFCQPKTSHPWPQWKCRILGEQLAQQGPDAQAYIADVTDSLNAMSTFTPSQVNRILLDAGQRHFQISRPSSLRPPWQDVQHVGNIRDMWTQYRRAQRQFLLCVLQVCGHASDPGGAIPDSRLCIEQCGATADSCVGIALISSYNRPRPRISIIDLTQAFDRASRDLLEKALIHIGVPVELRSVLLQWVHAGHYVVTCEGHRRRFDTTQGIRQGCKLSPAPNPQLIAERWCARLTGRLIFDYNQTSPSP